LWLQIVIPNSSTHDMSVRLLADVVVLYSASRLCGTAVQSNRSKRIK